MGRKSTIKRLEPEARKHLEKLLREDRHTLDELLVAMREKFPNAEVSRSAIHRYSQGYEELVKDMREQQAIASLVVSELGENPDDKAGALLVQTITTLTNQVALTAAGKGEVDVETVRKLARAAKDVIAARRVDRQERLAIRQAARDELLAEQEARFKALGQSGEVDQDTLAKVIKAAYGLLAPSSPPCRCTPTSAAGCRTTAVSRLPCSRVSAEKHLPARSNSPSIARRPRHWASAAAG